MAVRAPPDRPVVQAIALADRKVVDAGNAASHQAALVKLPILVAERPKPVAAVVMPLIGQTYRDAVLAEAPQLFDQAVVQFAIPFTCQKGRDLFAAANELGTVPPSAFQCVGKRYALGIAACDRPDGGSPASRLIGTPRKRTISARGVCHGASSERHWRAAGRRG